jgi:ribonuclease HI
VEIGWSASGRADARTAGQAEGAPTAEGPVQGDLWAAPALVPAPQRSDPPAGAVERFDYSLSEPDTTNNRMALRSALAALDLLTPLGAAPLTFVTDSNYIVLGMTAWATAWRARGWRRKGGPIENLDLWRELVERAAGRPIAWRWVRGHAGHAKNEYANHLATRAAAEQRASGGLAASGFLAWLGAERAQGRYVRFDPDQDLR